MEDNCADIDVNRLKAKKTTKGDVGLSLFQECKLMMNGCGES